MGEAGTRHVVSGVGRHVVSGVGRDAVSNGTGLSAAAPGPAAGPEPAGGKPGRPGRRGGRWMLILAVLVVGYLALGGYDLFSGSLSGQSGAGGTTAAQRATTPPGAQPTAAASPAPVDASIPAPHLLAVASVTAFGPDGTADGDHQNIVNLINAGGQPWYSAWYATPEFGNLQSGTGLLLDMGQPVTVANVRLVLGSAPGADVQVRVGNSATLAGLGTVASAADVGGIVQLTAASPSAGRYVLVWFTRLPPDSNGQYRVDVYDVTVAGSG
jgi:hypothetical protein